MLGSLSIQQLSYIVALDETRHFGLASKQVGISQPTLSMQIQKLEKTLSKQIFDRTKQPIVPTIVGTKIIEKARTILRLAGEIQESAREDDLEVSGEISIGIIPTVSPYLLPRFIKQFLKKYPKVSLELHEWTTEQCIESLKKDRLDAAILATPLDDSQILEDPLYYEPFWIYASNSQAWIKNRSAIPLQDLHTANPDEIWMLTEGHCFRSQVLSLCTTKKKRNSLNKAEGIHQIRFESGNLAVLKMMVDEYKGMTLLPELALESLVLSKDKKNLKSIVHPTPTREISFATTRYIQKKQITDALKREIKLCLPQELLKKQAAQKEKVIEVFQK